MTPQWTDDDRVEWVAVLRSHLAVRRLLVVLNDTANKARVRPRVANAAAAQR